MSHIFCASIGDRLFPNEILNKLGFSVIRFSNDEVITSIDEVIEKISNYIDNKVLPYGEDSGTRLAKKTSKQLAIADANR